MIIAVTGHRPDKLGNEYDMRGPISKKIYEALTEKVVHYKPSLLLTGMALGVDMLFANVAINQKIPFIACIPFKGQESKWPEHSQRLYRKILSYACEEFTVCKGGYASYKMQKRNEEMVDRCDLLIGVWDGSKGGTYNCINYAIDHGREIVRINPTEL